jgi:DNA-binding XRE family transcriptional regulator
MEINLTEDRVARMLVKFKIKHLVDAGPAKKRELLVKAAQELPKHQQLALVRKNEGINQAQLAKKVGVSKQLISDYERNIWKTFQPQVMEYIQKGLK